MKNSNKICVGKFAGAHGVRGLVRLLSFTEDPESIFSYAPILDEGGSREFKIKFKSAANKHFIAMVDGVNDKEAADALRGVSIYIPRDVLPETKDNEFYDADLIGLKAVDENGVDRGSVLGIYDYGAGAFLEIGENKKESFFLPFKDAFVPNVDLGSGVISIVMPVEV